MNRMVLSKRLELNDLCSGLRELTPYWAYKR